MAKPRKGTVLLLSGDNGAIVSTHWLFSVFHESLSSTPQWGIKTKLNCLCLNVPFRPFCTRARAFTLYLCALLVKFSACVSLQPTFSQTYDISAAQGLAPYQGLGLQSVTMQTTPVPARSHSSPTCLRMALFAAELPLQALQHNPGAPQLHPYTSSGQLNSESQRVQLQGLWLHSFILL